MFGLMAPMRRPSVGRVLGELAVVVNPIPGDVEGHRRGDAGETVDEGGVFDLLVRVPGRAGFLNTLKRVPVLPYAQEGVSSHC